MRAYLRHCVLPTAVLAGTLASLPLRAGDRPSAKLVYARKGPASICPDEPMMRTLVAARLGYDPFRDDAERVVKVTITREAGAFRARLEMSNADGTSGGARTLTSNASDCNELAASIALSLVIAIDPMEASPAPKPTPTPSPIPSPTPTPTPTPSPSPTPSPTPSARAKPSLWPYAGLSGHAAIGAAPQLTGGLTTTFGLHAERYSVSIEGRVDAEVAREGLRGGEVRSSILAGALLPCLHHEVVLACGIAAYGSLRGAGSGVSEAREGRSPWAAIGARLGIEATIIGPLAVRAHVDGLALLTRTTLRVKDEDVWTTPALSLLTGLGFLVHFQ